MVAVVFVDFRKAFDAISHTILLQKIQGFGIAGDLWRWIENYLYNWTQLTSVNGRSSEALPVKCGVPQGSVIGPTLFPRFFNDRHT